MSNPMTDLGALYECHCCHQVKPNSDYYTSKAGRGFRNFCKKCSSAKAAAWNKRNSDRHKANKARHQPRAKNTSKMWRDKNRKALNEYMSEWRKTHAYQNRSRAISGTRRPCWGNQFFIKEAYSLARLRTEMTGIKWHVDHIVPLVHKLVCGLHVEANLQVITEIANKQKGNRYWPDMPE